MSGPHAPTLLFVRSHLYLSVKKCEVTIQIIYLQMFSKSTVTYTKNRPFGPISYKLPRALPGYLYSSNFQHLPLPPPLLTHKKSNSFPSSSISYARNSSTHFTKIKRFLSLHLRVCYRLPVQPSLFKYPTHTATLFRIVHISTFIHVIFLIFVFVER